MGAELELTADERHIMEHASAFNHPRKRSRRYRNHYVAGPEQDSWPALQALVARGLMKVTVGPGPDLGGMSVFAVTDAGFTALDAPANPKPLRG